MQLFCLRDFLIKILTWSISKVGTGFCIDLTINRNIYSRISCKWFAYGSCALPQPQTYIRMIICSYHINARSMKKDYTVHLRSIVMACIQKLWTSLSLSASCWLAVIEWEGNCGLLFQLIWIKAVHQYIGHHICRLGQINWWGYFTLWSEQYPRNNMQSNVWWTATIIRTMSLRYKLYLITHVYERNTQVCFNILTFSGNDAFQRIKYAPKLAISRS